MKGSNKKSKKGVKQMIVQRNVLPSEEGEVVLLSKSSVDEALPAQQFIEAF